MIKKRVLIILICFFSLLYNSFSQEALKSIEEEYYDFLSLTGVTERPTLGYRTLSDSLWEFNEEETLDESSAHIWKDNNLGTTFTLWEASTPAENWFARGIKQGLTARIYGPEWFNSYNTAVPYGQNDGALWQGRGYNTSFTAGARLEGYGFELTFKPQVSWMQNREFDINENIYPNKYSYSFQSDTVNHPIDIVQRYGEISFWNFDWSDSEIRWNWKTFTIGFGTQNPWLGPAYLNPMLGSNNAPGYGKIDIGIRKTNLILPYFNKNLGYLEGRIWTGQLLESDYFDNNVSNNKRMLNGLSVSYSPSFIPGFTIGINRIFLTYWRQENLKYLLRLFTYSRENALPSSNNDEDQKYTLFAEWTFNKVGFSIYGEFGRDDYSSDEETNPFHTAIYTIGGKQLIPIRLTELFPKWKKSIDLDSEFIFEWNDFEMSQDFQFQWPYLGFYAHGFVQQGYTHKGQILGAGTGWAGNSQFIKYKVYYSKGYTSFTFHRYSPNNNSVYSQAVKAMADNPKSDLNYKWYAKFETYFCYLLESNYYITEELNIRISFAYILGYKHNYITGNASHNFNTNITIKYIF